MIGVGPHTMEVGDWILLVVLQVGLLLLASLSIWLAAHPARPRSGR